MQHFDCPVENASSKYQENGSTPVQNHHNPDNTVLGIDLSITICADKTFFHIKQSKFIWIFGQITRQMFLWNAKEH